jgi:polyisoprenyl-phosphate glycosyltransferase
MNSRTKSKSSLISLEGLFSQRPSLLKLKARPKKLISVIIPAYNEAKNLPSLIKKLQEVFARQPKYLWEIIVVNDGSTDHTHQLLTKLARNHSIKYIELSRNFGKEIATTAGLHHTRGDAAILLDADWQHPPTLIPKFVERWEKGYEIVIGVRRYHEQDRWFKKITSDLFYKIINFASEDKITRSASDFRLVDRQVIDEFKKFTERNRLTRGLLDWMGFQKDYIYFTASPRKYGQPAYTTLKLIQLALNTLVGHSYLPLRLAGYLGLVITSLAAVLGLFMLVTTYSFHNYYHFSGPAVLAVLNLFLIGIVLSCLGLISLYIANIHGEVANRPIYVVRSYQNIDHGQTV